MDGYYFTVASKTTVDPNTGIGSTDGWDAVLWYKNFKSGGKNDGDTPDFNVQVAPIYALGGAPPINDPTILTDKFGKAQITFDDGSTITGSIAFSGIQVGDAAGELVRTTEGSEPVRYSIIRGDGRVFYTDSDGYSYTCKHFARNPTIIG